MNQSSIQKEQTPCLGAMHDAQGMSDAKREHLSEDPPFNVSLVT